MLDNYSLLIMNNGGIDLESFGLECKKMALNDSNTKKIITFWKETTRLLTGLLTFQKHDIIHFDLKPQNIVYDAKKNRINYIDFGHMKKITDSIITANNSNNTLIDSAFWNYPFEVQFLNRDNFMKIANMSKNDREIWFFQFLKDLETHYESEFVIAYETFIDIFTENLTLEERSDIENQYKSDFYKTLIDQISIETYDTFLEKSIKTIDIYGIGIAFRYMLNYTRDILPLNFVETISKLAYYMTTPDLSKRYTISDIIELHTYALSLLP